MPARSSIKKLPPEVRAWLDQNLVEGNFSGYQGLADELKARGFEISKSAVHRYGQEFEENLTAIKMATEQAIAFSQALPDDAGELGDALTRLTQTVAFNTLAKMKVDPDEQDLSALGTMIAKLNSAGIMQKKWKSDLAAKAKAAAADVEKIARKGGLSDEAAAEICAKILGIAS